MEILNSTLVSLFNSAIPANEHLSKGLGDLIKDKRSPEIDNLIRELLNNHEEIMSYINEIISHQKPYEELDYKNIIDQIVMKYSKSKCLQFTTDFNAFCSKAYFSNPVVLQSYELLLNSKHKEDILNMEKDKSTFSSLIKK